MRLLVAGSLGRGLRRLCAQRDVMLLAAVTCLARGIGTNFGELSSQAMVFVLLGLLFAGMALRATDDAPAPPLVWLVAVAVCAGTTLQIALTIAARPEVLAAGVAMIAALLLVLLRGRPAAVVALAGVLGVVMMVVVPWGWLNPTFDVRVSLQGAAQALLHGHNPYSFTFVTPNELPSGKFVGTTVHFQYLPGMALIAAASQLLGDVRIAAAIAAGGLALAVVQLSRRSVNEDRRALRIGALCIAMPTTAMMVVLGWVDVYSMAGLAGWIVLRRRHRGLAVLCLVLALSIKPTILVALVPMLLWSRRARSEATIAAVATAMVVLPFVLMTGPAAFYHDVIGVQAQLGARTDALTLDAALLAVTGHHVPFLLEVVIAAAAALFALSRRPRSLSDLLLMGAFLSTALFLVAKWAFFNYYFIPVWLLAIALGGRGLAFDTEVDVALPAPLAILLERLRAIPAAGRLGRRTAEPT